MEIPGRQTAHIVIRHVIETYPGINAVDATELIEDGLRSAGYDLDHPRDAELIAWLCDESNSDASYCMIQKRRYKGDSTSEAEWVVEPGASRIPQGVGPTLRDALLAAQVASR